VGPRANPDPDQPSCGASHGRGRRPLQVDEDPNQQGRCEEDCQPDLCELVEVVHANSVIGAVLVWLLPRGGSNLTPGQLAPTASAGADRLRQDPQDLQSAVTP
jgi:hypothetical protein